jgi:methionyl-tRNA formyltransferase
VSQPDKPVGRKKELLPTPVKQVALDNEILISQPQKLRDNTELQEKLEILDLDFIVVVAYGKIIPQSILSIPKHGCINLHGSILPLYRGASPVQSAIADGLSET